MIIGQTVAVAVLAMLAFWVLAAYNRLVHLRTDIAQALAELIQPLRERHVLAAALAESARAVLAPGDERVMIEPILAGVRQAAMTCRMVVPRPLLAGPVRQLAMAEDALDQSLQKLLNSLSIPMSADLADQRRQLGTVQVRIDQALRQYNRVAIQYHESLRHFPTTLIASTLHFDQVSLLALRPGRP
jgi:LemA protein